MSDPKDEDASSVKNRSQELHSADDSSIFKNLEQFTNKNVSTVSFSIISQNLKL